MDINDPVLFANWQLRLWCYFYKAPVILVLLFLLLETFIFIPKPQRPAWENTIGAKTYDSDCWLCRAGSSAALVEMLAGNIHSHTSFPPTGGMEIAADTLAFRFCGAVEGMWFFTTRPKPSQVSAFRPPSQPAKYLWDVYQRLMRQNETRKHWSEGLIPLFNLLGTFTTGWNSRQKPYLSDFCIPRPCPPLKGHSWKGLKHF